MLSKNILTVFVAAGLTSFAANANAVTTFSIQYSGASFGNNASAVGTITLDETLLAQSYPDYHSTVIDLSLTISGAASGNGTFTASDFSVWFWDTAGTTLDYSKELVGQTLMGGLVGPWGSGMDDTSDFNFINNSPHAPTGIGPFVLTADAGGGVSIANWMRLTSLTAASASVPEPSTYGLFGLGALGVAFVARRRKVKTA